MFPYAMMTSNCLFLYKDFPKSVIRKFPAAFQKVLPSVEDAQFSTHCIYAKEQIKPDEKVCSYSMVPIYIFYIPEQMSCFNFFFFFFSVL